MARRTNHITAQFAARHIAMLESPAYRVLSLAAHRVLSRIEVELGHHGGQDNGKLPVTYDDFVGYGVHRQSVRPAINELIALGFVEITQAGRAGNADFREPNLFRLTYRHSKGTPGDGTHEWKLAKTDNEAEQLAKTARRKKSENQCRKTPRPSDENRHRKLKFHSTKTVTTERSTETSTTL